MQIPLRTAILGITMLAASAIGTEIRPADPSTPLFRIYAPIPMKSANKAAPNGLTFDEKHPLLVVSAVSNLQLDRDRKGVILVLTPGDAREFAGITRKYNQGLLLLEAKGRVLEAMEVTAPVTNGVLVFKYPDDAAVAEYLRQRFHLGEPR